MINVAHTCRNRDNRFSRYKTCGNTRADNNLLKDTVDNKISCV